ncbi:Wall-associated receptor kinase 2 [Bienertia sinuspersici]
MGYWYNIRCNTSFNPPKPFVSDVGELEILDISETQIRSTNFIASKCYGEESLTFNNKSSATYISLSTAPFVFSDTANKFTVIGCDDFATFVGNDSQGFTTIASCVSTCSTPEYAVKHNGSCSGFGCCQTFVPKGLKFFGAILSSVFNHSGVSDFNQCGHAFIAEKDKFSFDSADLSDPVSFHTRTNNNVPVVVEWFVGESQTCRQAQKNLSSYACQQNSKCIDFDNDSGGYRCSCMPGYVGNPYLPPGCTDDNECAGPHNECTNSCINTPGSYICTCPKGYDGDGMKNGTGCTINSQFITWLSAGLSFVFLFLLILVSCIYLAIRRKKLKEKRKKFFGQNGGLLLKELLLPQDRGTTESSNIFSAKELKIATNNYSEDRVLGKGGFGMVYKGILKDGREVAIKKSKLVDQNETQVKEFVNEVVILTQVKHRNVVKLIGCCLETEVPLLVYEFVSNGTLFEHIHKKGGTSWLNWANCVRVATEAANALAYLHSAVSTPILHRDVKSANILVDKSYTAKIADFGASRSATIDQLQAGTKLLGTPGYMDPQSFQTYQLTKKSDVYSFGVVLAELLTKEKAVLSERKMKEDNYFTYLARYFVMSVESGRLMEIIDPQLSSEASEAQLVSMANLVKKCLHLKGEDRPTMREVALELEGFQNPNSHPWVVQDYEETTNLVVQRKEDDLYPVPSNQYSYFDSQASAMES